MSFLRFRFDGWKKLEPHLSEADIQRYLRETITASHFKWRAGMEASRGGRLYTQELRWVRGRIRPVGPRGRPHRASAPGAYPAVDTGRLKNSIRTTVRAREASIHTDVHYAKYLRDGTSFMAKRKMAKEALREGIAATTGRGYAFARWRAR